MCASRCARTWACRGLSNAVVSTVVRGVSIAKRWRDNKTSLCRSLESPRYAQKSRSDVLPLPRRRSEVRGKGRGGGVVDDTLVTCCIPSLLPQAWTSAGRAGGWRTHKRERGRKMRSARRPLGSTPVIRAGLASVSATKFSPAVGESGVPPCFEPQIVRPGPPPFLSPYLRATWFHAVVTNAPCTGAEGWGCSASCRNAPGVGRLPSLRLQSPPSSLSRVSRGHHSRPCCRTTLCPHRPRQHRPSRRALARLFMVVKGWGTSRGGGAREEEEKEEQQRRRRRHEEQQQEEDNSESAGC